MVHNCFPATSFLFTTAEDRSCLCGAAQRAQESYLYTMASSPRACGTSRPHASTSHTSRPKTSTRRTPRNRSGRHKLLRWQLLLAADRVDLVEHGIDTHVCGIEEENTRHRGLAHCAQPALTRKNVWPRVSTIIDGAPANGHITSLLAANLQRAQAIQTPGLVSSR
jgi:hypothetical protein